MHVGHFAAGFIGKPIESQLSAGTLVLASLLADLLWCVFTLAGVEQVQLTTGFGAANYARAINIALSHSLLMLILWGVVFAGIYFFIRRNLRGVVLLFVLVVTHWVLDVIAHRPDMPLAPGTGQRLGLGLWTNIPATLILEGGLWVVGIILYLRATRPKGRLAFFVFWPVVALVTLGWYNNIAGPPPPKPAIAPIFSLVYFSVVVAWSYWINRLHPRVVPQL